jgi:uncharacterized protein
MRILSFDGGGIRGVWSARITERLPRILSRAELLAGTSTGAINCAGLQILPPSEVVRLFQDNGPDVFEDLGLVDDIEDLWNLDGAKYYGDPLKKLLRKTFGDLTISKLPKPTLITSFNTRHPSGRWQPEVISNLPTPIYDSSVTVVDAVMRSTAAPTYFPMYQKRVDGGVWANHPGMAAVAACVNANVMARRLDKISVLSIGTGRFPKKVKTAKNDLGAFNWLQEGIIDLLLDGSIEAVDFYLKSLLGPRYFRLQIDIDEEIKLDDVSSISELIDLADSYDLNEVKSWMEGFW